jgi:hypothetical protein
LVWDPLIMAGGLLALDDTAGFFLGPNLQLQATLHTGAYVLLADVGGISFLQKKHGIVSFISDVPLSTGSLIAYLDYIGARSGAMDPLFRLPSLPRQRKPQMPSKQPRRLISRLIDASPRTTMHYIRAKLTSSHAQSGSSAAEDDSEISLRVSKLRDVTRLLEWLHGLRNLDERTVRVLAYLQGCVEIQSLRVDKSILRLAQAYDLRGERHLATEEYLRLKNGHVIPEIQSQAERGMTTPFRLPKLGHNLLLRQYNSELAEYRDVLLFTKELPR